MDDLNSAVRKQLDIVLQELYAHPLDNITLLNGDLGSLVLLMEQESYISLDVSKEIEMLMDPILDAAFETKVPPFCAGKAGINWFFSYLFHVKKLIEPDDLEGIFSDDIILLEYTIFDLKRGNYDFLHGSLGIAYSYLYNYKPEYNIFFNEIFKSLDNLLKYNNETGIFQDFNFQTYKINYGVVDLGLAHGVPSILKFCTQCYKKDVCATQAIEIMNLIVGYLLSHTNNEKYYSKFPNEITSIGEMKNSRLAWCYGDMGVCYIMLQVGEVMGNQDIVDFATNVLIESTKRRDSSKTSVIDAGICHGSAGITHIYNRLWHKTKNPVFKEATDYWMQQTLDYARFSDGIGGYKSYDPTKDLYSNNSSILEGSSGIGLVMHSYLTGNFDWDYCIMLND